jgi:hypothetical protein
MSNSNCSGFLCPYDGLPCDRFDDDLNAGLCEIKLKGSKSDVCSRFVLKQGRFVEVFFE